MARILVGVNDDDVFHPMIFEAYGTVAPQVKDALADLLEDVHERLGWASAQLFHRPSSHRRCSAAGHGVGPWARDPGHQESQARSPGWPCGPRTGVVSDCLVSSLVLGDQWGGGREVQSCQVCRLGWVSAQLWSWEFLRRTPTWCK